VVFEPADQQADADYAVEGDHQRREDGVSRIAARTGSTADHQHHDEADLDDGHRHGQREGSERLSHPVRHHLGMVHGGDHPSDERESHQAEHHPVVVLGPRQGQHQQSEDWRRP
jgi:hypothetical protein